MQPKYTFNDYSSSDEEPVYTTLGTSIDDAFGIEIEDDVDQTEEDDYSDNSWE